MASYFVRTPASSANLGAGFDVLGMALNLYVDLGKGEAPDDAQQLDEYHPAHVAFAALGGRGPLWMRCSIPMARGLGFSGAVRVGAAALAVVEQFDQRSGSTEIEDILRVAVELEGHGDNAGASLFGGVQAFVDGRVVPISVGPHLAAAAFVAWIPDVTTSTDKSRRTLSPTINRRAAVKNIGRAIQFVSAFAHDDPMMLIGSTEDHLHQADRLPAIPGASDALEAGTDAGAWCGWLSGSGPTVGFLCHVEDADAVVAALPKAGHCKVLAIDTAGVRRISQ